MKIKNLPVYKMEADDCPEQYIIIAHGLENDLQKLATRLSTVPNFAIISSGIVCNLVIVYTQNISYSK